MNDSGRSFLIACGLHGIALFGNTGMIARAPSYDVQAGTGGVEISLIAALPASAPSESGISKTVSEPAGKNTATTFYLPGGAATAGGGRFRNPAPAYPYEAIRQGQEGLVILDVSVDKNGYPTGVEISQRSGFPLLDQSALQTVWRWRFDPATIGFLPVKAKIRVPVRFVLGV